MSTSPALPILADCAPWSLFLIIAGKRHLVYIVRRIDALSYPCRQQILWKSADTSPPSPSSTTPPPPTSLLATPSCWYDWAKDDPNFVTRFHDALMASKKRLHILALSVDKPLEFCIWYYYHKYKKRIRVPNSRNDDHVDDGARLIYEYVNGYGSLKNMMKLENPTKENSEKCVICDEGGELLCCEMCPGSVSGSLMPYFEHNVVSRDLAQSTLNLFAQYHLACQGLTPADLEGDEVWSCRTCVRKRKLQLSPPCNNSPTKQRQRLVEFVDDNGSSTLNRVSIMSSLPNDQLPVASVGIDDGKGTPAIA